MNLSFLRRMAVLLASAAFVAAAAGTSTAQTADVQLIHNSPDPALRWLDVYVNDSLVKDSLLFRLATEYMPVPAGPSVEIGLAPANSSGPQDVFETFPVSLQNNRQHILVVHGLLDPSAFKMNPDDLSTSLSVLVRETKNSAATTGTSEYLFVNSVTDAPSLNFTPAGEPSLADNVAFGSTSEYVAYDEFFYLMGLAPTAASARIIGFFDLDVGFLQDQAFTVLTSGFVNKFENAGGPELKLMIVAADGFFRTVELAPIPEDYASMQVINNSPDVAYIDGFDILFDGGRAVDDLPFQRATPTFAVPSGVNLSIGLADTSGSQVLASTILSTEAGTDYLVMINGLVNPDNYAPNPSGRPTALAMTINPNIRRSPDDLGEGEFVFSNGIPDAPPVDLTTESAESFMGVPFGEMTGYTSLTEFEPLIELFRQGSPLPRLAGHIVEIPFVLGRSFVIYASGFDNPSENLDGSRAQLMLALQDGAIVQLKAREILLPFSRLQLVHASADPSLQVADLYVDQFLVADDAPFRSATAFFDVFSGKTVTVGFAPAASTGFRDVVAGVRFRFDERTAATGVVRGVFDTGSFAPNPDGIDTEVDVHLIRDALESGPDASQFTVLVASEVTDLPTVNVLLDNAVLFGENLAFSEASSYGLVEPRAHSFDFRNASTANRIVKSFVDFSALQGRAGILVAAGFADSTAANQEGPFVSSFLALDDGTVRRFDHVFTNTESDPVDVPSALELSGAYPNPFSDQANVRFDLPEPSTVSLELFDVTGRVVGRMEPRQLAAGRDRTLQISAPELSSGIYIYRLRATSASGSQMVQGELLLVR